MIPVSTLYDEYIDWPKLTEQKKPIWVYSSPLKRGRNNNYIEVSNWIVNFSVWCCNLNALKINPSWGILQKNYVNAQIVQKIHRLTK